MSEKIQKTSHKRELWIDVAKGLGMVLVIFGHLPTPYIRNEIYTFHLPLFFFLSGYVFNAYKYEWKDFVKRKIKTMIVPYFCLGIVLVIFTLVWHYTTNVWLAGDFSVSEVILDFFIQRRKWTLWFLTSLFLLEIIFYFIVRITKNNFKIMGLISIIMTIIGITYYNFGGIALPWNIDVCFTSILFFYGGYIVKNVPILNKTLIQTGGKSRRYFAIFLFINVLTGVLNKKISGTGLEMFESLYGCAPLTYISAFTGIEAMIILSQSIKSKFIEYIGMNSIIYFAWHQTIMITVITRLYFMLNIFQGPGIINILIGSLIACIIICLILTGINSVIMKSKFKFIAGR